jgi:hypothetical protein
VAALLSALPAALLIRAQKLVAPPMGGLVKAGPVAPATGLLVSPLAPSYHW